MARKSIVKMNLRTTSKEKKPRRYTRRPGPQPSQATTEKRTEMALLGQPDVVAATNKKIGRPRKGFDDLAEHIKYIIDCSAVGYTAQSIVNLLKTKYGEESEHIMSRQGVYDCQKRYMMFIVQREREIRAELPIISPVVRMRVLQEVIEEGKEGVDRVSKSGEIYKAKDFQSVIAAIKELNAMQKLINEQPPDDTLANDKKLANDKAVIMEYVTEKVGVESDASTIVDFLKNLKETMKGEYEDAINSLITDYES